MAGAVTGAYTGGADNLFPSSTPVTSTQNGSSCSVDKHNVVAFLTVTGAVTGTTPSLTVKLQESPDGTNWADVTGGAFTAVTATNSFQKLNLTGLASQIRSVLTVSGTTPSFGLVNVYINQR